MYLKLTGLDNILLLKSPPVKHVFNHSMTYFLER